MGLKGLKEKKGSETKITEEKAGYQKRPRKRYCYFCREKIDYIDYKDVNLLRRFLSDRAKIRPRRVTGTCAQHQAELSKAVKNAREVALLPYPRK